MCECFQIGGKFIAEDPDCPMHGYDASRRLQAEEDLEAIRAAHVASMERQLDAALREVDAWRTRFPSMYYRPQDDVVTFRLETKA
jgi:hypothetical protein